MTRLPAPALNAALAAYEAAFDHPVMAEAPTVDAAHAAAMSAALHAARDSGLDEDRDQAIATAANHLDAIINELEAIRDTSLVKADSPDDPSTEAARIGDELNTPVETARGLITTITAAIANDVGEELNVEPAPAKDVKAATVEVTPAMAEAAAKAETKVGPGAYFDKTGGPYPTEPATPAPEEELVDPASIIAETPEAPA